MPFNSILDGINPMAPSQATSNLLPSPQQSLFRPRADAYPAIATMQSKQFENYRRFGDIPPEDLRKMIYDNTLQAFQSLPAAANSRYNLSLRDVGYDGKDNFSLAEQKKAILSRGTLGRKVRGTWVLSDAEGNEVGQKPTTLGRVPYLTDRGTFIYNGTEYTINNQMRLRPGVYTRTKENSEVESHVNVSKGMGHKISLDPGTGIFRVEIGQAKIPLTPLLQAMGVSDSQLKDVWGSELAAANIQKKDVKAIDKLYAKLKKNGDATDQQTKAEQVAEAFRQMEIDPDVVEETLGERYTNVDETTLLAVTKRLLGVMRGEEDPDDRDAMQYQKILGPEDFFAERVAHSQAVARNLLWKASATGTLDKLPSSAFKDALTSTIIGSGLAQAIEQINMGETLDQQTRITRMGYGGIPSNDSVPLDARAVHPSQVGFLDLLRTPECYDPTTEVMTRRGWVFWPDVRDTDEFACLINGRVDYFQASQLIRSHYTGTMYGVDTGRIAYLVTPNHRLWVKPLYAGAQYRIETAAACHERFRHVQSGGFAAYTGEDIEAFTLPRAIRRSNNETTVDSVPIGPWAELMGWWLGEGNTYCNEKTQKYRAKISQCETANPANCEKIVTLLNSLPFAWSQQSREFGVGSKQLAIYFKQFGKSHERFIPEELLRAPAHARQRLYAALLAGEGRRDRHGDRTQFCTTSPRLADDFVRLAFSLGFATRKVYEPDSRPQSNHGGAWVVHVHKFNEHQLLPNSYRGNDYYTTEYDGEVFCATVPGGLLYVRRGDTVGHWSGNSSSVGVDLRLANIAVKGPDGNLYSKLRDLKGNDSYLTPREFAKHTIAFPGELAKDKEHVPALRGGKMIVAPRDEVDYEIPHMEDTFSALNNLVPMKSMIQGQRSSMASRMTAQALPLERPEAPLVQSGVPGEKGRSYEQKYGEKLGALRAKQPGRVMKVTPQAITVKYADGNTKTHELLHYMPNNRKTLSHQTAVVRPGDVVEPDQLLARSNVTDDQGTAALGVNARVAYIAYDGKNYEDAIAISESMAKRFTSEHGYQHEHEWGGTDKKGLKQFISAFPTKYDKKLLENFSSDGVVKPGTVVNEHDPLILVASERELTKKSLMRGGRSYADKSITWDHHTPGEVTDVVETPKGVNVVVRSLMPMQEADKMSGRMGDKGVVRIIPDDQMPTDENGEPFEVLLNPLGIISRRNPAQIVETVLGKIAAKTGEPYRLPDFEGTEDMVEFAIDELRKHKMKDLEPVIDPRTGRKIDGILTGNRWFMKLHHSASGKEQGRGIGGYSADGEPAKGGSTGSKKIGLLETSALLSHGAGEYLRDAKLHRGQAQPEFWSQYMSGYDPPPPRVPHVYEKFVDSLKASGINVVRDGPRTHIMALTDKDVDQLSGDREIKNASTVNWKNMEPIKGGLFDETLVGGHGGGRWAHIKLHEPLPSPVMEEPIRRLLGLTAKQFEGIISGEEELGGLRGPKALAKALERIDLPKAIQQAQEDIKSGKKTARDAAIRKLGYLKSAQRLKIHPKDWMLSKVPVLPPIFRPVSTMGDKKLPLVADPNYLYKEVLDANQAIKDLSKQLGEDGVGEERLQLYRAFKGVTGLGDPIHPKNQERNVSGILKTVFGNSPKRGTVQSKLLGSTVDLVGRGVTVPESNFDMDTIGLPETKVWDVFRPQVMRKLVRNGYSRAAAAQAIEDKSDVAKKVLQDEVENGVVVVSRAPTLHRYGVMAFRPKITKGHAIRVNPLVYGGFGLDNDGNCCDYDEIIKLDIDEVVVNNTRVGKQFLTQLSETVMRLYSQELINLSVNGRVCVSLPIGEVPRVGEPTINAKGQKLYAVPEGVDICSYDHDSGRVIRTEITGLTVDEAHATVRVTTARGRDVIVSDNESLAVFDTGSGQLIKMRPDEAIGKHVPYIRKEPHPGDSLNRDIGWWYAVMAADGWKTDRMVGYSKNDETCRREVERIARTQLHENFVRYEYSADKADGDSKYGKSCKIHLNGGDLAAVVWEISRPKPADRLQDRTALYKSLPPQLLSAAGEECLLGIFSGLLDGDSAFVVNASHAKKGRKPQMLCRFQTSSKFFRNDILQVCRYLGIRTAITYSPPRGPSNEAWVIIPSTVDLKQIAHKLTCIRADAIAWLRDFESYEVTRDNMDIVPILPAEAVELAAIARNHREHTLYTTAMVSKKAGYIGRQSALRLLALAGGSDAPTLRRMASCHDIHWDTVKSIEDTGVRDVFDLMIPETKVFPLANGLVIYDTMNYHTPFSPEAKKEALAKMLPSRNLFDTNSFKAHYTPTNEYVIGLYEASARKDVSRKPITFRTKQDAIAAYKRGEIGVGQPIEVLET